MLKRPTDADINKLGNEISQIIHQRFLLATIAITVLGVIGGWLFAFTTHKSEGVAIGWVGILKRWPFYDNTQNCIGQEMGWTVFLTTLFLFIIIGTLFFYGYILYGKLRIYTTYLRSTEKSNWEWDWWEFRQSNSHLGYRKGQAIVFLIVGTGAIIAPIVYDFILHVVCLPILGLLSLVIIYLLFSLLVWKIGFGKWFDPEKKMFEYWQSLKPIPSKYKAHNATNHKVQ